MPKKQLRKSIDIDNVAFLPKPFSVNQLAEARARRPRAAREAHRLAATKLCRSSRKTK